MNEYCLRGVPSSPIWGISKLLKVIGTTTPRGRATYPVFKLDDTKIERYRTFLVELHLQFLHNIINFWSNQAFIKYSES